MNEVAWSVRRRRVDDDDLAQLVEQINRATMEDGEPVTLGSLSELLADDDHLFLTVHAGAQLAGTLHAIHHLHPSSRRELYVDEVDTDEAFRRQGVAAAMMREACDIAARAGASAVWLATGERNTAARALYDSLGAPEPERVVMYTFMPGSVGSQE